LRISFTFVRYLYAWVRQCDPCVYVRAYALCEFCTCCDCVWACVCSSCVYTYLCVCIIYIYIYIICVCVCVCTYILYILSKHNRLRAQILNACRICSHVYWISVHACIHTHIHVQSHVLNIAYLHVLESMHASMHMYIRMCMYIYIYYLFIYAYRYVCIYSYMHAHSTCINVFIYENIYTIKNQFKCMCVYLFMRVCMYITSLTLLHTRTQSSYVCVYVCVHTYTYWYIYLDTYNVHTCACIHQCTKCFRSRTHTPHTHALHHGATFISMFPLAHTHALHHDATSISIKCFCSHTHTHFTMVLHLFDDASFICINVGLQSCNYHHHLALLQGRFSHVQFLTPTQFRWCYFDRYDLFRSMWPWPISIDVTVAYFDR
jgi:hypothetical protein